MSTEVSCPFMRITEDLQSIKTMPQPKFRVNDQECAVQAFPKTDLSTVQRYGNCPVLWPWYAHFISFPFMQIGRRTRPGISSFSWWSFFTAENSSVRSLQYWSKTSDMRSERQRTFALKVSCFLALNTSRLRFMFISWTYDTWDCEIRSDWVAQLLALEMETVSLGWATSFRAMHGLLLACMMSSIGAVVGTAFEEALRKPFDGYCAKAPEAQRNGFPQPPSEQVLQDPNITICTCCNRLLKQPDKSIRFKMVPSL